MFVERVCEHLQIWTLKKHNNNNKSASGFSSLSLYLSSSRLINWMPIADFIRIVKHNIKFIDTYFNHRALPNNTTRTTPSVTNTINEKERKHQNTIWESSCKLSKRRKRRKKTAEIPTAIVVIQLRSIVQKRKIKQTHSLTHTHF